MSEPDIKSIIEDAKQRNADVLYLFRHGLSSLPAEIGQVISLEDLNVGANHLSALPSEIGNLRNLRKLDVGYEPGTENHNRLDRLPAEIGSLTNLEYLNLGGNQLHTLPPEIGKIKSLKSLYLEKNKLTSLPWEFAKLTSLRYLDLRDNPLPIPPEILAKTNEPQSIINYYFASRKKSLNEVKLLVVGQGGVGKTSLIRRLVLGEFDAGETKTEGITINRWTVDGGPLANDQQSDIQLNIWDFGGQEIMHATHQFFLTKRSLYLLVIDSRLTQEENRVEYWLKIIQSFGGGSLVLVIGNKTDQHPLDIDRTGLQKKYPDIVGILETSAATGAGIDALKSAIAAQVNSLPHVRDPLPQTWFTVKTNLEALGREQNFISYDAYLALCEKYSIHDQLNQRTLIGFLHDLGVVLHFQDDPRLEVLGILNPQWVTNGVYKILNSHALFQNKGVLTVALLDEILDTPEYPRGKRLFIVDMMRKFELCYEIEPNQTFLVPDLLPKDEPFTGNWDGALAFQYQYNVLPSSIISRFIVRMNTFIHKTVWRLGVVLKSGTNIALVKADFEDREISIWIQGRENTRRDFLSSIRMEFEAIHRTIPKIEARGKVPVPAAPSVVVDYEHLLKLERKGIVEFIPEGLDNPISVRQLLDGVAAPDARGRVLMASHRIEHMSVSGSDDLNITAVKGANVPAEKKSALRRIFAIIFARLPHIIGRVLLDIFGRDKATDSTARVLGYIVIVVGILLLLGIVDLNTLVNMFENTWRFFFPVKNP